METKPLPVGAPLPKTPPHELMVPDALSAAKALQVDAIVTKPLPVGAPLPPLPLLPHAVTAPEASSAAKAL